MFSLSSVLHWPITSTIQSFTISIYSSSLKRQLLNFQVSFLHLSCSVNWNVRYTGQWSNLYAIPILDSWINDWRWEEIRK
jgi:hypothetical protein